MARISTSISPKYVKDWTISNGIREIIQNLLDAETEFQCDIKLWWTADGFGHAKDYGPGMELRHFAMGVSEKSENSIGKYGEGLKLAFLVFAREKRPIEVRTKGKYVRPIIMHSKVLDTDVMVFEVEDIREYTGTQVVFQCSREEFEAGKNVFSKYASKNETFKWLEKDKISFPGKDIYINGAAVGHIADSLLSYHLKESETGNIGNRDREIVDAYALLPHIRKLISRTNSVEVRRIVLDEIMRTSTRWDTGQGLDLYCMTPEDKENWLTSFHKIYGKDMLISDGYHPEAEAQVRYRGYKIMTPGWSWANSLAGIGVETVSEVLLKKPELPVEVSVDKLAVSERRNFDTVIELIEKHYAKIHNLVIVEGLAGKLGHGKIAVDGMYDPEINKIYICQSVLSSRRDALDTILHETVHQHSGELDLSSGFERSLISIICDMVERAEG